MRTRSPNLSVTARTNARSAGRNSSDGCAPGALPRNGPSRWTPSTASGRAAPRLGRPVEHRRVRVERRAADREQQPGRAPCDQPVDGRDDVGDGCGREVDRAGAVHLQIEEAGCDQRVTEIDGAGRRVARARRDDPAVRDRHPGPVRRLTPLAVQYAGAREGQRARDSFHSAQRSLHSPRSVRGTRVMKVLRAGRNSRTSTGISPVRRPARSTRRMSSVSNRSWPKVQMRGTAPPPRGALP